jgi:hypothetical protein
VSDSYKYAAAVMALHSERCLPIIQLYDIIEITDFVLQASTRNVIIVILSFGQVVKPTHCTSGPSLKVGSPTACNNLNFNPSSLDATEEQMVCTLAYVCTYG